MAWSQNLGSQTLVPSASKRTAALGTMLAATLLATGCDDQTPCTTCSQTTATRDAGIHGGSAGSSASSTFDDAGVGADGGNDHQRKALRSLCHFGAGALPDQTLEASEPWGSDIPIDHFIVIMQENRSFDHYFQMLPKRGQPDADVAPDSYSNPDPSNGGKPVAPYHETAYCGKDIEHGWDAMHQEYADGAMNGFVAVGNPGGRRALGYYDESDLPYYYGLAKTFAIGDRYFAATPTPTYPNRMYAASATSFGLVSNSTAPQAGQNQTIYRQLQDAGIAWMIYSDYQTMEEIIYPSLRALPGKHFGSIQNFLDDAKAGTLPAYAWVESQLAPTAVADDEHPPSDVQVGERFVSQIVDAAMHGAAWPSSAVFINYDEHGSFFDHVPPPHACPPDAIEPILSPTSVPGRFDRYGMRVPFMVVSPFAKPHYVSHDVLSHTSILRMVQARYALPALSARDANATPPFDLFDFANPAFMTPPTLPSATVDATELARCKSLYP